MREYLKPGVLLRLFVDALLVNLALGLALQLRYLNQLYRSGPFTPEQMRLQTVELLTHYSINSSFLTVTCLVVFACSGFYTSGQAYSGKYKALVVARTVAIAFLIYGTFCFGLQSGFRLPGLDITFSTGLTFTTWLVTGILVMILAVAARLWSRIWAYIKHAEQKRESQAPQLSGRVLVIGGAGYIGSALIPKLLEGGYKVRILDRMLYGKGPVAQFLSNPKLELVEADFRQVDQVVTAMREVDAVIHLGALVGDPACALDEDLTIEINLMATRMIAEVARGSGIQRFIFASTCSVYGANDQILDERSDLRPVSLYARSKIASERVLMGMATEEFCPTCLRFGTIYGLSGRTRFDLVVNLLTAKAILEQRITLYGGDQWRPFLHVDDAALAVFKTLEAPLQAVKEEVFNVGSNEQNRTLDEIAQLIKAQVPEAEILELGQDADRRNYRVNFDKISRVLQFSPAWTLSGGIKQVLEAVKSGQVTDYDSSQYSNVKSLTEGGATNLRSDAKSWAQELLEETLPAATAPLPTETAKSPA
jgi:nucleoside-diphosphate-sugar epimerase